MSEHVVREEKVFDYNASEEEQPKSSRQVFDWKNAPDFVKAPPRVNLGGKTVTIAGADILLPNERIPWERTRRGDKEMKKAPLVIKYDVDGQVEYLSGMRFFKNSDGTTGNVPGFDRNGTSQVANLFRLYAVSKKKNVESVTLKEFMEWLNSRPKVVVDSREFTNIATGEKVHKNIPAVIVAE